MAQATPILSSIDLLPTLEYPPPLTPEQQRVEVNESMPRAMAFVRQKKIGRPVTVPDGSVVAARLPSELIKRLDAHAAAARIDRSTAIRALLGRALKG